MKQTMFKAFVSAGLCLLIPAISQGQTALQGGSVDAKLKPDASGNTNSGSVFSPDLFNGTANVSIPIYSYGAYGVSLSYNTAGIKTDELSGPVGLHFNLIANGTISRSVKDVPDEMNIPTGGPDPMGSGSPYDGYGIKGKWCQYFGGTLPSSYDQLRYIDDESDDFIFAAGGLSFTFNIGLNGFVHTHPHTNVKIELWMNGGQVTQIPLDQNSENVSFRVRDAQGNWYYFIKGDVSRKIYGDPLAPDMDYNFISKWVVQKIVTSDGQVINYQYTTVSNSSTSPLYVSFSGIERGGVNPEITSTTVKSQETLTSYSILSSIKYPNNVTASFIYTAIPYNERCDDPGSPVLREVKISSEDAGMRYVFDQAYALSIKSNNTIPFKQPFGSCYTVDVPAENFRYHRLILKGISIKSLDGTITEPYYTFGYNYNASLRLPPRFSGSQDYFGYYNGKIDPLNQNSGKLTIPYHIPKYGTSSTPYGVDKSDDANFAVAGLLDTIINAYGGMTLFTYEGHQSLTNPLADAGITLPNDAYFFGSTANDGVRVKEIKTIDSKYPGKYQKQTFTYSGGQRFMPGGYFDYPVWLVNPGGNGNVYNLTPNTSFNGMFVSPHQFVNGSNHGYSNVTITISSDAGQLSKRVIAFQNVSRGSNNTAYYKTGNKQYFQKPFTDKQYIKEWEIGLPLVTTDYDKEDRILSRTINTYSSLLDSTSTIGKVGNFKRLSVSENGVMTTVDSEAYRPYTGISLLTKTVIQKFIDNNNAINDTVTYSYDGKNNLALTTTRNSRGEYFQLKNVYNYDVSGPGVAFGNQPGTPLYNMTNDGIELKVSTERWKGNLLTQPSSAQLYDASITGYTYTNGKLWTKKLHGTETLNPLTYTDYRPAADPYTKILTAYNTTQTMPSIQLESEVIQYDVKGNPVETQLKGKDVYKAMIWDTITGNKVAEVINARLQDIGFTSFESIVYGASYTGNETITNGGFVYKHWGITLPTDPVTGKAVYKLVNAGPAAVITSPVLTSGKKYILTFWSKENTPTLAGAGLGNIVVTSQYSNGTWTQWKTEFTPSQNAAVTFTTTATSYIDEIRLFPAGSVMTNSCYVPLFGASSVTDARGRITYYEYDVFGRNTIVRDQEGNIISKQEYHIGQ
ncbi:MAG: hypothetical protein WC756_19090 [Taibaiella sp.]|jgi:hypothetical protein